jgi:hypothetical protein
MQPGSRGGSLFDWPCDRQRDGAICESHFHYNTYVRGYYNQTQQ